MIKQRYEWLQKNNIDQWKVLKERNYECFINYIIKEQLYIAEIDNCICGAFVISEENVYINENRQDIIYLYHFIVKLGYKGIGEVLVISI